MNIKEAIGVVNYDKDAVTGEEVSFEEQYNRLIDFLGGTNAVMKYVPLTKGILESCFALKVLLFILLHSLLVL